MGQRRSSGQREPDRRAARSSRWGLTVAEALTSILTLLTVVYFWLTEHARLQRYALAFVRQGRRARVRSIWNQAEARLGMWVRAQLILMGAIGLATAIA